MIRYFNNISWLTFGEVVKYTIGLFVSILVVRYLGPEKLGILEYAIGIVTIVTVFSNFGTDGYVIRDLSSSIYSKTDILGTSFLFRIAGFILCLIIIIFINLISSEDKLTRHVVFLMTIPIAFKSFDVINFYFQSKILSKYVVFSALISLAITSILKVYFVLFKGPFIYLIFILVLDSMIISYCYLFFYKNDSGLSIKTWRFNKHYGKKLIKFSLPILISTIAYTVFLKVDAIMIQNMLGSKELGIYSIATRLINMWYVFPMMITTSVFPALVKAKGHSSALYLCRLQQWFDFSAILGWAICLFMFLSASTIIPLLYGDEFLSSVPILKIYSVTGLFLVISFPVGKYLLIEEKYSIPMIRYSIAAIANVVGNYLLIPIYGISGAAYASVFSTFIAFYGGNLLFRISVKLFIMQTKSLLFLNIGKNTKELIRLKQRKA